MGIISITRAGEFILECYWAANTYRDADREKCLSLAEEQLINETAEFRIIGLTETRPIILIKLQLNYIENMELREFRLVYNILMMIFYKN